MMLFRCSVCGALAELEPVAVRSDAPHLARFGRCFLAPPPAGWETQVVEARLVSAWCSPACKATADRTAHRSKLKLVPGGEA